MSLLIVASWFVIGLVLGGFVTLTFLRHNAKPSKPLCPSCPVNTEPAEVSPGRIPLPIR